LNLLPFQAGADESSEKEEYLDVDLYGKLIDGVKLETPEVTDDHDVNQPDLKPG